MISFWLMNKALSISGQQRFVEEGYHSFAQNLKNFDDYDVFIHTWEDEESTHDIQIYKPCRLLVDTPIDFNYDNIHYPMFYSIKQSLDLVASYPKKYDCVIRTRFDAFLEDEIDVELFPLEEGVYSPDVCGNPAVISDWFNFGNYKNMMMYTEIYDNITQYGESGVNITSGEEIICHHLREINNEELIKVQNKSILLIRSDDFQNLHSTWRRVSDLPSLNKSKSKLETVSY